MFYNAKNCTVSVHGVEMEYIVFGKGQKPLIMLPGLTDGLKTVKGMAIPIAMMYKQFARQFKVYMFSRKAVLEMDYTTKDMARDLKIALDTLGISSCYLLGVSQGGMIAQRFAIDYPEMVDKLIIAVSSSRPNRALQSAVTNWMKLAQKNDYRALMVDTAELSYSPKKLKSYRKMYPIMTRFGKPKDFNRFLIQAKACLSHHTYDELNQIQCPTFVIGGGNDQIVGIEASEEMAERIYDSKLFIYRDFGHAADAEAKDFNQQVIAFLE